MKRLALLCLAALALAGCSHGPEPVSQQVQNYYEAHNTLAPFTAPAAPEPVTSVRISAESIAPATRAIIFGDSWTQGAAASSPNLAYAPLTGQAMGWDLQVMGGSGTGYLNPGSANIGTYPKRISELASDDGIGLVVVQGSVNDQESNPADLPQAAAEAWAGLGAKYQNAQIVVIGPAANALPANPKLLRVDQELKSASAAAGLPYISPLTENWLTPKNYTEMIDVKAAQHPSTQGHAYLAERTVTALRGLVG